MNKYRYDYIETQNNKLKATQTKKYQSLLFFFYYISIFYFAHINMCVCVCVCELCVYLDMYALRLEKKCIRENLEIIRTFLFYFAFHYLKFITELIII